MACGPAIRWVAAGLICLSISPARAGDTAGIADIALQGYYLGGNSGSASSISGLSLGFQSFLPGIGVLSGNFEGYGREGQAAWGDNFLQVRGLSFMGLRWGVTGGD